MAAIHGERIGTIEQMVGRVGFAERTRDSGDAVAVSEEMGGFAAGNGTTLRTRVLMIRCG
jgi:hypothetical protein